MDENVDTDETALMNTGTSTKSLLALFGNAGIIEFDRRNNDLGHPVFRRRNHTYIVDNNAKMKWSYKNEQC